MKHSTRCPTCHRALRRSNPANARLWALYHVIAEKVRPGGQAFSADTWHHYFKSRFLGCDDVILPNRKVLTIPRSTAALDVDEFAAYMEKVEAWAAERGVYLDEEITT